MAKTTMRALMFLLGSQIQTSTVAASAQASQPAGVILTIEGTVEISRARRAEWSSALTNQPIGFGDSLRTGPRSRATVRLSDLSVLRVNEKTLLEIHPQADSKGALLDLRSGSTYFFNRSKPGALQFRTPLVSGAIRGTEFTLEAEPDSPTRVVLIDGEVFLNNAFGDLVLHNGEEGVVAPNQSPQKSPMLSAINAVQWSLYYPAVLDIRELGFNSNVPVELAKSVSAYNDGDLLAALSLYPAGHQPASNSERIYHAGLLLAVGQVDQSETQLKMLQEPSAFAEALRELVAAVKHAPFTNSLAPESASGCLAQSYYLQSRSRLNEAIEIARRAVEKSPEFGHGWVRLAELEFSAGHSERASQALARGLRLSPKNAQALVLQGYVMASRNNFKQARAYFDEAIATDGALANGWVGRGLCEIRAGDREAGRQDLQVAAALEPNRSDLRSYLGKAWAETHNRGHAEKELTLAKRLDPQDPTPWLYSALLNQAYNQNNQAIEDLETSKELNNNRSVYRSALLLDQDQAVRSANLARIYQDAGMLDVSVREASRAVDLDYGNYSAHLFLADSYDSLRDPRKVNLRYETPWFSELLVAQLLAPVGSVPLSQNVSQQEYSRFFEGNRVGFFSGTEYLSRGAWLEDASEFGNYGNSAFALDQYYRSDRGERPNNDVQDENFSLRLKQQITSQDSLFFEVNKANYSSGDVLQYYDPAAASRTLRINENQEPNLFAGYHREWAPGIHTLLLAGRLQDTFSQTDPLAPVIITTRNSSTGQIVGVSQRPADLAYQSDLTAYSTELQQIFQTASQTIIVGARYQTGDIDTDSFVQRLLPVGQTNSLSLTRISGYGYYSWQVADPLQLTAGLSYDYIEFPQNNEIPPVSTGEDHASRLSPKAGIRWTPFENTTLRGAYTRSLGGVFYDTSVRLEPTQVAGFNQAFRSIIPESVAGLVPGSKFETFGVALDQEFSTRTYLTIAGELLKSHGERTVGTLDALGPLALDIPSGVSQVLDYQEKSVSAVVNQLLGKQVAAGVSYRVSRASLDDDVPAIAPQLSGNFSLTANRDVSAILQQLRIYGIFNHPSGFFAKAESIWSSQSNQGYAAPLAGDSFWQFNVFAGYRFPRRAVQVQLGVLNIGNQDYNLNPLNLYADLPRSRTFYAGLKLNF
ncbi:MAG TPA: TonB-dependent receptor [Verrucomicrobiae bacterium]|nr:TonB-dependent receptor [Verrucomicrobiae bacterium]